MSMVEPTGRLNAQAMIEELRYWAPSVNDVARVYEFDEAAGWRLFIIPSVASACPVELLLSADGRFDIEIAGESYTGCEIGSRTMIIDLLDAIANGDVVQRRWLTMATGGVLGLETLVRLKNGSVWRKGSAPPEGKQEAAEVRDRHFLRYRR